MCRCLCIQPSGCYAWRESPLSHRAREDDLLDHGETCCPNRVARLTRLAGVKAQIGWKHRPGSYGGKPSLAVDNTLDRQVDVAAPDRAWVTDITYTAPWKALPIWLS